MSVHENAHEFTEHLIIYVEGVTSVENFRAKKAEIFSITNKGKYDVRIKTDSSHYSLSVYHPSNLGYFIFSHNFFYTEDLLDKVTRFRESSVWRINKQGNTIELILHN